MNDCKGDCEFLDACGDRGLAAKARVDAAASGRRRMRRNLRQLMKEAKLEENRRRRILSANEKARRRLSSGNVDEDCVTMNGERYCATTPSITNGGMSHEETSSLLNAEFWAERGVVEFKNYHHE